MDSHSDEWQTQAQLHLPSLLGVVSLARSHVDLWQLLKEQVADATPEPASLDYIRPIFDYAWWCVNDSRADYS
jgi:hypothetical protein